MPRFAFPTPPLAFFLTYSSHLIRKLVKRGAQPRRHPPAPRLPLRQPPHKHLQAALVRERLAAPLGLRRGRRHRRHRGVDAQAAVLGEDAQGERFKGGRLVRHDAAVGGDLCEKKGGKRL